MSFKPVSPSIQSLNLGICNCFLLRGSFGYALVDTGLEKHGDAILKALAKQGILPTQIKLLLLTHAHPDHAGSAAQLKKATGATVVAHQLDAEIIESGVHQRPMTPAPGLLNRILFELFVKDLTPVPITKVDRLVATFDGLQPGTYAFATMHDGHGCLRYSKEGWAVSNNVTSHTHPPKFDEAKIQVNSADQTTTLNMHY